MSSTSEACEIPSDASSVADFTNSGNFGRAGARKRHPNGKSSNAGVTTPCEASTRFVNTLSRASIIPRGLQPV
jgi:hypothetical protein